MIDTTHITHAIASHATWKYHLRQAIRTGESEWNVPSTRLDDQCEFGKWLRTLPPEDRTGPHWTRVRDRHQVFHEAAAHVLDLALAGRRAEAEDAIALESEFARASNQLTLAMNAWQKDLAELVPA
ncbi:MAG: CZB domain-containing protein [Planctomycetota bacterium]|jgi:hypothetical protein